MDDLYGGEFMAILITAVAYSLIALSFAYALRGLYRFFKGTSHGPCSSCQSSKNCTLHSSSK